jgi:hypothetical protein
MVGTTGWGAMRPCDQRCSRLWSNVAVRQPYVARLSAPESVSGSDKETYGTGESLFLTGSGMAAFGRKEEKQTPGGHDLLSECNSSELGPGRLESFTTH